MCADGHICRSILVKSVLSMGIFLLVSFLVLFGMVLHDRMSNAGYATRKG